MQACKNRFLPIALSGIMAIATSMSSVHAVSPYSYGQQELYGQAPTVAMQFFGGSQTSNFQRRNLREQMPAPQPLQLRGTKPFQSLRRPPTLSPYLNLDARQSELGVPPYHLFVLPLQQQRKIEREQATHLRKLQQRLRVATSQGIVSNNPSGGAPSTGHSSQFLNLGGYFPEAR